MKRARLEHGDCVPLMAATAAESASLVILDPPYGISVGGVKWDRVENYMPWARKWLRESARVLRKGGALLLYGSPEKNWVSRMSIVLEDELGMKLVQHLTWAYTQARLPVSGATSSSDPARHVQGGDSRLPSMVRYGVRTEQLAWFEKPGGPRTFNPAEITEKYTPEEKRVALAKGVGRVTEEALDRGKPPTTFVSVPRENSRSKERAYGKHPSMKPLALCERLIRAHSDPGDLVVVPFAGSGSELLTAAKLGREAIGFEKEAGYVELMRKRAKGHSVQLDP